MYIVLIKNKIQVENRDAYIEESKKMAEDMMKLDCCISSYVLQNDSPDEVTNLTIWKSKEDYEKHNLEIFLIHKSGLKPYFIGNTTEIFTEL